MAPPPGALRATPPGPAAAAPSWQRIAAHAAVQVIALQLVGWLGGFSLAWWEIYGDTLREAWAQARRVHRVIGYALLYLLCLYFLRRTPRPRVLHLAMLFLLLQALRALVEYIAYGHWSTLFYASVLLRHLQAYALAWATDALLRRRRAARLSGPG
jgi:hypothetical protein